MPKTSHIYHTSLLDILKTLMSETLTTRKDPNPVTIANYKLSTKWYYKQVFNQYIKTFLIKISNFYSLFFLCKTRDYNFLTLLQNKNSSNHNFFLSNSVSKHWFLFIFVFKNFSGTAIGFTVTNGSAKSCEANVDGKQHNEALCILWETESQRRYIESYNNFPQW